LTRDTSKKKKMTRPKHFSAKDPYTLRHALPFLPGHQTTPRKHYFGKTQVWQRIQGMSVEVQEGVTHDKVKMVKTPRCDGEGYDVRPAWDACDRWVLRFYAITKSAVMSPKSNCRNTMCKIHYYLEDDTMTIYEAKDAKYETIPCMVRRHRVPHAENGAYITDEHLSVGKEIEVYVRKFLIYACDPFTRQYYELRNRAQAPDWEDIEEIGKAWKSGVKDDLHAKINSRLATMSGGGGGGILKVSSGRVPKLNFGAPDTGEAMGTLSTEPTQSGRSTGGSGNRTTQPRTYNKLFTEVALGGGHINQNMQSFMENDRRVCRFYAVVDDIATTQFERKPFVIFYYLSDHTIMICEQFRHNSGRNNAPIFFKRGKMPKVQPRPQGVLGDPYSPDEFITYNDLRVGRVVDVLSTKFYIYDADKYTRDYYEKEFHIILHEKKDIALPEFVQPVHEIPPYTGYGSLEDSMGSVHHLLPKPPKKDMIKRNKKRENVLRFNATRLMLDEDEKPSDLAYVLRYYVDDDTLSIHVPAKNGKNSGEVVGPYLERGQYTDQLTEEPLRPHMLVPQAKICLFGQTFIIDKMDEFTNKYFKIINEKGGTVEDIIEPCDVNVVLAKLRNVMGQQTPRGMHNFLRFNPNRDGVLTLEYFKLALEKFGFHLADDEVLQLMRHFDRNQDGQITYNEFCDAIMDEDYVQKNAKPACVNVSKTEEYEKRASYQIKCRGEDREVRRAIRHLSEILHNRPGLTKRLRFELDKLVSKDHMLNAEILQSALLRCGYTMAHEDVTRCLEFICDGGDSIDYIEFLIKFPATFHDFHAVR